MSSEPSSVVQNLLRSLQGGGAQSAQSAQGAQGEEQPFTTLADLLAPTSTLPLVETADMDTVDNLLSFLPPSLVLLAQDLDDDMSEVEANPELAEAVMQSLNLDQKKDILRRVLRSPQFTQSLGSLTVALRDGGLPMISEALNINVKNGGFMRRGGVPLGGGEAVQAFLEGVKEHVQENRDAGDQMETD